MNIEINYLAVILAGVASMGVGFLWYSPMMFGKAWIKLMGYTEHDLKEAKKKMGKTYAISFAISLLTAYVLSHVMSLSINFFHYTPLNTGLTTAFWMWLGFIGPVQLTDTLFGEKKWDLFIINTGYQLASLMVMGVILAVI